MTIAIGKLRQIQDETVQLLHKLPEGSFVTGFTYSPEMPAMSMQYWEYELSIWENDETWHDLRCGCFTGSGRFKNSDLGIHTFFENNGHIMDEFARSIDEGQLDELIPLLQKTEELIDPELVQSGVGGAALNLYSYVFSDDEWLKNVCEEYILIIHLDEKDKTGLDIGCQQNERYRIKVPGEKGPMFISVPFDKVRCFEGHERVEGHRDEPYYEYQVALSFAGEDRLYVSKVAKMLRQRRIRVFYDEYEKATLWGKDIYVHLDEVYRKRARFCVLFLSESYKDKLWTNHERESAQARAFEENKEYILPVRLDDTEIPGIKPTIGYIHKDDVTIKELVDLVHKKIYGF